MILTDAQSEAEKQERQWARDLADKFDTTGRAKQRATCATQPALSDIAPADQAALEAAVRRLSSATEFRHRPRPRRIYLLGAGVSLLLLTWIVFGLGSRLVPTNSQMILAWLVLAGSDGLWWFVLWQRARPICPECHQNIRTCPAEFCHVCGQALGQQRCTDCGVDDSWLGWLHPHSNRSFRWITFCPGCGVELDTKISRWRGTTSLGD